MQSFKNINPGFNSVFKTGSLSIGLIIPIESYTASSVPSLEDHAKRAVLAEEHGFKALWVRDVPLHVPSFGDAGQTLDPFTYLGYLAGRTSEIALCTGSIALPLHHPVHVAKSAASIDHLSNGRLILGVASGDRPSEFPALGFDFDQRGETFKKAFQYIRASADSFPTIDFEDFGTINGQVDILPKPPHGHIPMLITGHSRQTLDWIAEHGDGWMYYPRNLHMQQYTIAEYRSKTQQLAGLDKPFMQPLYVDLHNDDDYKPTPIHLGFRIGIHHLIKYFKYLEEIGVNHVGINLRFNQHNIEKTIEKLAKHLLPHFHYKQTQDA